MIALVERIASGHATRESVRRDVAKPRNPGPGRPRAYVFNYRPTTKAFTMRLQFRKGAVERREIIETLETILQELRHTQD